MVQSIMTAGASRHLQLPNSYLFSDGGVTAAGCAVHCSAAAGAARSSAAPSLQQRPARRTSLDSVLCRGVRKPAELRQTAEYTSLLVTVTATKEGSDIELNVFY